MHTASVDSGSCSPYRSKKTGLLGQEEAQLSLRVCTLRTSQGPSDTGDCPRPQLTALNCFRRSKQQPHASWLSVSRGKGHPALAGSMPPRVGSPCTASACKERRSIEGDMKAHADCGSCAHHSWSGRRASHHCSEVPEASRPPIAIARSGRIRQKTPFGMPCGCMRDPHASRKNFHLGPDRRSRIMPPSLHSANKMARIRDLSGQVSKNPPECIQAPNTHLAFNGTRRS